VSNPSGKKGARWEVRLVDWLTTRGHPHAHRRAKQGRNDRGDVGGITGWVIEAKNCRAVTLAAWLDEAEKEAANAGVSRFAVVFPRKSHTVDKAYAVMPAWLLAELMREDV
jgi:hypothetical protein